MEKRTSLRHPQDASIVFSRFNAQTSYSAKMLNYSRDGMYFETNHLLPDKTDIFFRVDDPDLTAISRKNGDGLRTISLARIKWWRVLYNDGPHRFGIGVQYY